MYLGCVGGTSEANARTVFPILEQALRDIPKQTKRVLESFLCMLDHADSETQTHIARYAETYDQDEKARIRAVARKIQKRIAKQ